MTRPCQGLFSAFSGTNGSILSLVICSLGHLCLGPLRLASASVLRPPPRSAAISRSICRVMSASHVAGHFNGVAAAAASASVHQIRKRPIEMRLVSLGFNILMPEKFYYINSSRRRRR